MQATGAMKSRAVALYYAIKESFWFLPSLMAAAAAAGAIGSVSLDRSLGGGWMQGLALAWSGGAEGARSVLSVIAASTMTVVSIVFSITINVLAQTSAHYGPRVLRNFTRDRRNQFVLGAFIAAFLFSLLVLRTVRSEDGASFVPYLSVNIGIGLSLLSLAVLIFFIHHIATAIQADFLIARIGDECRLAVEKMFPDTPDEGSAPPSAPDPLPDSPGAMVRSDGVGYVQVVDHEALFAAARQSDTRVTILTHPGAFVSRGQPMARVTPAELLDDKLADALHNGFHIGDRRTPDQDLAYVLQELVEIAARALSPGINEPFTAVACIDQIGATLRSLAARSYPSPWRKDDRGAVRLVTRSIAFPEALELTLGMIRRYANGSADIYRALLQTMDGLASFIRRTSDRDALLREVRRVTRDALSVRNPDDRERVLDCARAARDALRSALGGHAPASRTEDTVGA